MSHALPAIRRVSIEPLSMRTELGNVLRVGLAVAAAVWLYLLMSRGGADSSRRNLLPFQALIQNRPAAEQRVFRELQEGLLEAERARSTTGAWPAVSALAADGIPPFAMDPTAKDTTYKWELFLKGPFVNYLGIPAQPDGLAWLLLIQEPESGAPPDPAREDEEHHRLVDGTLVRVSTWTHPNGSRVPLVLAPFPQAEGWTQLYAVGPAPPTAR